MKIGNFEISIEEGHFIGNDGCSQNLEESPIQLSFHDEIVQSHNLSLTPGSGGADTRIKNLLYFNLSAMDLYFYLNDSLPVKCPICSEEYLVTKEHYFQLKKESF